MKRRNFVVTALAALFGGKTLVESNTIREFTPAPATILPQLGRKPIMPGPDNNVNVIYWSNQQDPKRWSIQ